MKTLLITNDFPPMPGGESTWYARICATVPHDSVVVLAPRFPGDRAFDAGQPYRIVRSPAPVDPRPLARLGQLTVLGAHAAVLVRRDRVSTVHIGHLYLGPVALALRRLLGVPYVLYLHGGEMAPYMRWPQVRRVARAVFRGADRIVVNSEFTRGHYAALGMSHPRVDVLSPGVDTARFRPGLDVRGVRARYGLDGARVLLTVGRLVERKGHDMVIRAIPRLRCAGGPLRYLIVGTGPEEARLRALAQDVGCADDVVFAGHVGDADLPPLYASCDVFVMPSRALDRRDGVEGFGIVFLEAGACGKPVVGGRSGGVEDAVQHGVTGILVDPLRVDDVALALGRLLADPEEAARMGREGRRRAVALEAAWRSTLEATWSGLGPAGRPAASAGR